MVVLIAYDLHKPDRDYQDVEKVIKSSGSWAHIEESVWLVESQEGPAAWRDKLKAASDDATYFVVRLYENWAAYGLTEEKVKWLQGGRSW